MKATPNLLLLLILACGSLAKAEKFKLIHTHAISTHAVDTGKIFVTVDKFPQFPGGMQAFSEYIAKNLIYPPADKEKQVSGKVFVVFVIEKDGSLSELKALRGPTDDMKKEAVRVLTNSPKWIPGRVGENPVRVQFTVPINFALN